MATSLNAHIWDLCCAVLCCAVLLSGAGTAHAQSWIPQSFTGNRDIPLTIDTTNEFITDAWQFTMPRRYAADLRYRRRILANIYARSARITYTRFDVRPMAPPGGLGDFVEFRWNNGLFGGQLNGTYTTPVYMDVAGYTPTGGTAYSGTNPGFMWEFRSGATEPGPVVHPDPNPSEGLGVATSNIRLTGTGVAGLASDSILAPHELVTGLLLANDDIVRFRLPASLTTGVTVAMWLQNPNTTGVSIWARCNAPPNPVSYTAVDTTTTVSGQQGAFLDLPQCSGVWYFAVTNTSNTARVFHLTWGQAYANNTFNELRVGISWTATAAELNQMRASFREAAWRVYGAFGGTLLMRSFRYYNNANTCDDGFPAELTSCSGQLCDFCLQQGCSGPSNYDPVIGNITLCNGSWLDARTIMHEIGHDQGHLPDEYENYTSACPTSGQVTLCLHSVMGSQTFDNRFSLCTTRNHRTTVPDWRYRTLATEFSPAVIRGPTAYACDWVQTFEADAANSMWSVVSVSAPVPHPEDRSPHNVWYPQFITTPFSLGQPLN